MVKLKKYQNETIHDLLDATNNLLSNSVDKNKILVFQAPTGAGKTVIMAKFIEELTKKQNEDFAFLWLSIGKGEIHVQSKRKLEKIFSGSPRVTLLENEMNRHKTSLSNNEVIVANWEKLRTKDKDNNWTNIYMRDGEKTNFREVLINTNKLGRKIVLIIDESHYGADTDRTNELKEIIDAEMVVEVSATPRYQPTALEVRQKKADIVQVEPYKVIEDGMIKKEVLINDSISEIAKDEESSQGAVLEAAYRKQNELKRLFEKIGTDINPLVLIQIPNSESGTKKIDAITKFFKKKGIDDYNKKLAFWTDEYKSDFLISVHDVTGDKHLTEFLVFKQAIDTGWDCPRAYILVKFRETKSVTFEIQTIGRILRMPEQKHYEIESLNKAYIYTNLQSFTVKKEDYNPNIIKHLKSVRKDVYSPLNLSSFYKRRIDRQILTSMYYKVFEELANKKLGISLTVDTYENRLKAIKHGLNLDIEKLENKIIENGKISHNDFDNNVELISKTTDVFSLSPAELDDAFYTFITSNMGSYNNKQSITPMKQAIYKWFKRSFGDYREQEIIYNQTIVLGNKSIFSDIIQKSIKEFDALRKELMERDSGEENILNFQIPSEIYHNDKTESKFNYKGFLFEPCFLLNDPNFRSFQEEKFEKFLESNLDKIEWWWKNGVNKVDYFGIRYETSEGIIKTFYPDYLVMRNDGHLGIFEIKDKGDKDILTKYKAERFYEYVIENNDKKIFGGVTMDIGATNNEQWRVHFGPNYDIEKNLSGDFTDWLFLDDLL